MVIIAIAVMPENKILRVKSIFTAKY